MSLLSRLHQVLPKPALFALYGGIGGLLGALLLGEVLWLLLRPAAAGKVTEPAVRLAASPTVSVYQKGKNRLGVKLARSGYDAPVNVRAVGSPAGLSVGSVTLDGEQTDALIEIEASGDAPVGPVSLSLQARGDRPDQTGEVPVAVAEVEVTVLRLVPPPPALRLAASPEVVLDQDGKNRFQVKVARDRFRGAVRLEALELPAGVVVAPATVDAERSEAELEVTASPTAAVGTHEVRLHGSAADGPSEKTTFRLKVNRSRPPQVDVMFVLDVTGSMQQQINGVSRGIVGFAKDLQSRKLDARVGLIAFRDRKINEESVILRFEDDKPFTKDVEAFSQKVGKLRASGGGDPPESVMDALALASRQPFRDDATRVLLLICDDEPHQVDKEVKSAAECNEIMRKNRIHQLHLVIHDRFKSKYAGLRGELPGQLFDLAKVAKDEAALASALPKVSSAIAKMVPANLPPPRPQRALEPPPGEEAKHPVAQAPPPTIQSVHSSQAFEAGSAGWLIAASSAWTGVCAAMICLALLAGQQFYLQRRLPSALVSARGFVGGLAAGLLGGLTAQLLFQWLGGAAEGVFRVLGWAILGGLVGLGMAFVVPNLRAFRGLLGGALGGLAAALGFLLLAGALGDVAGRLVGAFLLGASIGLMVALVEAVSRRVWLEVSYGGKETRSVNLGPEPVRVGGDGRACAVYARGAAAVALRYWLSAGRVMCEDVPARSSAEEPAGRPRRLGGLTLTVRSAAATRAAPPAAEPQAPAPAPVQAPIEPKKTASPNACPACGRVLPGPPGRRYCVVDDLTF
jgi:Mg-chelatase subunit ChlD